MSALELPTADPDAVFQHLYETLHAKVLAQVRHKVGDPQAAEDICQEVWTKLSAKLPEYLGRDGFNGPALVFRSADNKALDHLRRGQSVAAGGRVRFVDVAAVTGPALPTPAALTVEATPETDALAGEAQSAAAGRAALSLELLPNRYRWAIWLREWRGYEYADAAAALGCTLPAYKSLLMRARAYQRTAWERACASGGRGPQVPLVDRFWASVEGGPARADDRTRCWGWIGGCFVKHRPNGTFGLQWRKPDGGKRMIPARRLAYALARGVIPPWARLENACGRPDCVNPWHLTVVAPQGPKNGVTLRPVPAALDAPDAAAPAWRGWTARRRRLGLSLDALAARSAVTRRAVADAERGRRVLPTTVLAIEAALAAAEAELTAVPVTVAEVTARRKALGLSQRRLSLLADGTSSLIHRWEVGATARPMGATLRRIGEILDRLERERAEGATA